MRARNCDGAREDFALVVPCCVDCHEIGLEHAETWINNPALHRYTLASTHYLVCCQVIREMYLRAEEAPNLVVPPSHRRDYETTIPDEPPLSTGFDRSAGVAAEG